MVSVRTVTTSTELCRTAVPATSALRRPPPKSPRQAGGPLKIKTGKDDRPTDRRKNTDRGQDMSPSTYGIAAHQQKASTTRTYTRNRAHTRIHRQTQRAASKNKRQKKGAQMGPKATIPSGSTGGSPRTPIPTAPAPQAAPPPSGSQPSPTKAPASSDPPSA